MPTTVVIDSYVRYTEIVNVTRPCLYTKNTVIVYKCVFFYLRYNDAAADDDDNYSCEDEVVESW